MGECAWLFHVPDSFMCLLLWCFFTKTKLSGMYVAILSCTLLMEDLEVAE